MYGRKEVSLGIYIYIYMCVCVHMPAFRPYAYMNRYKQNGGIDKLRITTILITIRDAHPSSILLHLIR